MTALIKAEFRKLFTVRSTYIMVGFSLAIIVLFAFYIEGIRAGGPVSDPNKLASEVTNAVNTVSIFGAIIALLLMTHEYRYNTIMYTLTSSNSRTKTLLAKILAITIFAVGFTLLISAFSPLMTYLGLQIKGYELAPQTLYYRDLVWRALFVGWGYGMLGLLLGVLLRNQVAALGAFFFAPITVEPLLGLLLKQNIVYLPFTALQQVIGGTSPPPPGSNMPFLTPGKGALVFSIYLVIGWLIAWLLFLRRDAN